MRVPHVLLAGLAVAACAAPATEDDVEIAADALVAGRAFVGPVRVEPDRLLLQRDGNEGMLGIARGRILVGAATSKDNPSGFLRRAISSEVLGDRIAIVTEPAQLGEVIRQGSLQVTKVLGPEGDVGTQGNGAGTGSSAAIDVTFRDKTLLDFQTTFEDPTRLLPVRSFDIQRTVRLTQGHVRFAPAIDLDLAIARGNVERFEAVARGALDASFELAIDTKTSIDIDLNPAYRETLERFLRAPAISVPLFESRPWTLPTQYVGIVPVTSTVRFRVVLECDVTMNSQMHADASLSVTSSAAFGARFRDGSWRSVESPKFEASPSFVVTRQGAFAGTCGLRSEVGFYFYDLLGPTLSVTPYAAFDVERAGTAWGWRTWPGLRGAFGGRAKVLGWEVFRGDVVLFDTRATEPLRGVL